MLDAPAQTPSVKLSADFHLKEFTASRTAKRKGIDNTPSEREIDNLRYLCHHFLQPIRDLYDRPVVVTSGFRCPELNEAVGGVPDSLHVTGEGADFYVAGGPSAQAVFQDVRRSQLEFEELILYPDEARLHVGVTRDPKREVYVEVDGDYVAPETRA